MAETGDAVTAMNWLGRSMQQFPSYAVNAAAETQVAMAEVDTALREANVSASVLGDTFTAMGRDSTAMLMASAAAAKVGFEGKKDLVAFSEAARKFGFITKQSTDQAAQSLSDLSIVMGYKTPDQVERLASGMTALSRRTNVSTSDLVALVKQTGQAAKAVGVTEAGVMGLAASMSQQGLSARAAGVPISNLLNKMLYSVEVGEQLAAGVQMSGDRLKEFGEAVPDKKLEMFMQDLGKMDKINAERMLSEMSIASGQAATKMFQAAQQAQNLGKYTNWVSEAMKENTALTKESDKILGTFTFQVKELWTQTKALFQMTGKALLPVLTLLVQSLRGLLSIVMLIPRPILAAAAAFSALGASILMGTWAAQTKLVTSSVALISATLIQMKAVGGLTGAYNKLTSAQWAQSTAEMIQLRRKRLSILESAGRKYTPPKGLLPMAPGGANVMRSVVGTSGATAMLTSAAAALGVSVAALLGIILAVVAAIALMGLMIYKGIQMMRSAEAQTRAFGAALIIATGPIGVMVLGLMAMAPIFKRTWDQMVAALQPLVDLGKKLMPIFYALGVVFAVLNPFVWVAVGLFAILYAGLAIIVGMAEAFGEVMLWAFEPFIPLAEELGVLLTWLGEAFGGVSEEGWGIWEVLKWIGKVLGYIVFGPFALLIKALAMVGDLIVLLVTDAALVGEALAWPFIWLGETVAEVWDGIVDYVKWSLAQIMKPMNGLGSIWSRIVSAMLSGLNKIMSPLRDVWSMFSGIAAAAASVWKSITGSSPWHIQESMTGEVIPALNKTRQAFDSIADASFGVMQTAQIRRTAAGPTIAPPTRTSVGAAAAPAARPPAPAETGPREIKISVPVTLVLDGMVVGRAVAEQIVQINERLMNAPGYPLRGVEPAY
jgi:TP901 family phage tail tape measure protein